MLNGWKTIAAYLKREERTAMRWAAERGLPVHRAPGPGKGSVYALTEEIDTWMARGRNGLVIAAAVPVTEPPPRPRASGPSWRRRGWIASALIVAAALLIVLGVTYHDTARDGTAPKPVFADAAAKALFLQATYHWNLRTRAGLALAAQEYGEAIGRDPRVPAAYVGLANTYLLLREYGSLADDDAYPRAEAAARAAVALNAQSPEAHRALAFIAFWWRQDRGTARREFARAIAARPDDPLTHHWLANALLANGEAPAALREIEIARDLDPTATAILADRGPILYVAGRRKDGLDALNALVREQPDSIGPHRSLADIALSRGDAKGFLREYAMTARLRGDAAGLADSARWQAAGSGTAAIEAAMLRDARRKGDWFEIARLSALAQRTDEAKSALARACAGHEPAAISAASDIWLARALSPGEIAERCGHGSLVT